MPDSILALFCHVDDFCQRCEPRWHQHLVTEGAVQRMRRRQLCLSEIMTIVIAFHTSHYCDFKAFYLSAVHGHWHAAFPGLGSYSRFVDFLPSVLIPLCAYLRHCCGACPGMTFVDATALAVCHNRRIAQHRVFAGLAKRGKTSLGWFFGFKLPLCVNDKGEVLALALTPGNPDDRQPGPRLAPRLFGKLFADKGSLSQTLTTELLETFGRRLFTPIKRRMKNRLLPLVDKLLLRKRVVLESIIDQLKNISQIEHSRHRSVTTFFVNLLGGLIAYCHQPKKPALHLSLVPMLETA
jgi:DDE family transposase